MTPITESTSSFWDREFSIDETLAYISHKKWSDADRIAVCGLHPMKSVEIHLPNATVLITEMKPISKLGGIKRRFMMELM